MSAEALRPVTLRREGDGLRIDWSDGVSTFATFRHLRANCPCAGCQEERAKPPDPFNVLAPSAMRPVGHYAYQITWNDGHDTGIYTLETLRRLGQPA
jgi:DUF971 family protein